MGQGRIVILVSCNAGSSTWPPAKVEDAAALEDEELRKLWLRPLQSALGSYSLGFKVYGSGARFYGCVRGLGFSVYPYENA